MDLDALARSPLGQLVPIQGHDAKHGDFAYFAYLADPLPEDVHLESRTWTAVLEASSALAKLDQACAQLKDARLLIRPALWREALDTSALEGTHGALRDLLEAQLPSAQFLSPETVEIRAYERIALHAFDVMKDRPISTSLLSELQGELFRDARMQPRDLGTLRHDPVWIGPREGPIYEARFVPAPPGDQLQAGIDDWEKWIETDRHHLPPVLKAALSHYQFETLHPFGDGNGRIGRLVVVLQLLRGGAIRQPAVTVSPWFLKRREDYQNHLLRVSATGEWGPWIEFFSAAVRQQCESLLTRADELHTWLAESRAILHQRRWSGAIHRLLEDLIEWPVTTIADTASRYDVSVMNATRMIDHLVEADILKELTGRNYGRIFGAHYVIETVEKI